MKEETVLQRKVMLRLSELGYIPMRMNVGLFYTKDVRPIKIGIEGTPDLLILKPDGGCFWIEMKTLKGKLRESQIKFKSMLSAYNHRVYVVNNIDMIEVIHEKEKNICTIQG